MCLLENLLKDAALESSRLVVAYGDPEPSEGSEERDEVLHDDSIVKLAVRVRVVERGAVLTLGLAGPILIVV